MILGKPLNVSIYEVFIQEKHKIALIVDNMSEKSSLESSKFSMNYFYFTFVHLFGE
jgi:hypothetical protein